MKRIKIYCEGVTDQVFIADCLDVFFNIKVKKVVHSKDKNKWDISFGENCQIIEVGGCNKLSDKYYQDLFKDNIEEGGINIVIFDADFGPDASGDKKNTGNKGIENAKKKLESLRKNGHFDFYLWPNNEIDGEVENLLRQLVPFDKEKILKCIESHQECLKLSEIENVNIADLKSQVGYYLHSISKDSKERNRDYKDPTFWNLNEQDSENLKRLKVFLEKYFKKI